MSLLVKAIAMVSIMAVFSVLLALDNENVSVYGWDNLRSAVSRNPFQQCTEIQQTDCIPAWPTFPGPASVNTSDAQFYLKEATNDQTNCPRTLSRTIGTDPAASVTLNAADDYECWLMTDEQQSYIAGTWTVRLWLSSPGTPTYSVYVSAWNTFWGHASDTGCQWISQTNVGSPVTLTCEIGAQNILLALQVYWNGGGNLLVSYDGATNVSSVSSPGFYTSTSTCRWDNPLSWAGCAGDAASFAGAGFLYIGGIIWTGLNYVGAAIGWILSVVIGFFSAVLGMGLFIGTLGGTAPQDIQIITGGVFVVFMVIVFLEIIRTIRGSNP